MALRARAATPATVFLLAAFVLLLLSVISVPITKTIALGSFNGVTFGVFGFCINGNCSPVQLGYNPDQAIQTASSSSSSSKRWIETQPLVRRQNNNSNFSLPPSARSGLSNILIVHVIACALTLVALILCLVAHIRSPSHSVRFLLAIFIIGILTTILTLLSFLVDLLVFVPHFAIGTWIVLAATICNAIATILLCCGRRTLIGRKAMRRRIAENAEMNGQNYFQEEAAKELALRTSDQSKIPQYAEFEVPKPSSDRVPLNSSQANLNDRNGSDRSNESEDTGAMPGYIRPLGLPNGPSPYSNGGQYPPPPNMGGRIPPQRGYGGVPPVRTPSERSYPPGLPQNRSNVSLNSMNRPPRSGYDVPPPMPMPMPAAMNDRHASSIYSEYVPARQNWRTQQPPVTQTPDEDFSDSNRLRPERPRIDTQNLDRDDNPYMRRSPEIDVNPAIRAPNRSRENTDSGTMIASYYEDVDPRFDDQDPDPQPPIDVNPYLTPPRSHRRPSDYDDPAPPLRRNYSQTSIERQDDYQGPRSPAASTSSHFTSVSQRGINPRWQPAPPPPQFQGEYNPTRRKARNDQMQFLSGNPDFELPVPRSGRRAPIPGDGGGRYPMPR